MTMFSLLWPISIALGLIGLAAFFWSLKNGQYGDAAGDAQRIIYDEDAPLDKDKGSL
ncbi:MAG: cbb3-type cytochrome oxidase assembly protein CcoS [Alphaproteobacteria bacterium]